MELTIKTEIDKPVREVESRFNKELFNYLSPPFPRLSVLKFDGIKKGGTTHLKLNFLIFSQEWISYNTHSASSERGFYFIDVGKKLPFPLKKWKHQHIVFGNSKSCIVDRVKYSTGLILTDLIIYPAMWLMFYGRKPSYKSYYK